MTELERRALLGDKQAQEECTEKGIVLPCPLCGREITTRVRPGKCAVTLSIICFECRIEKSVQVEMIDAEFRKFENEINNLINNWNTRPAPPIGQCRDCDRWRGKPEDEYAHCRDCDGVMEADNFCRNFEPRSNKDGFK